MPPVRQIVREEGARAALRRARGRALARVHGTYCVFALETTGAAVPPEAGEVRQLGEEDVEAFRELRPDKSREVFLGRLRAGHVALANVLDGRLVSVGWTRFDVVWFPHVDRWLPLLPDEAYVYDIFTHSDHRRRGLAAARARVRTAWLAERGYRRVFVWVNARNAASLALVSRLGYRLVARVRWLSLGPLRRTSLELVDPTVRLELAPGRRPEV